MLKVRLNRLQLFFLFEQSFLLLVVPAVIHSHRPRYNNRLIDISSLSSARSGLWEAATTTEDLVDAAGESLSRKVLCSEHHVLDELLPYITTSGNNVMIER